MRVVKWEGPSPPTFEQLGDRMRKEGLEVFVWSDPPGAVQEKHSHPYDEVRWVVRGKMVVGWEGGELFLEAGDRLDLPAGTDHWGRVAGDGPVFYLYGRRKGEG